MKTSKKNPLIIKLLLKSLICIVALSFIIIIIACDSSTYSAYAITFDSNILDIQNSAKELFGENKNIMYEYLYNYNDSPDYMMASCKNSYAIYLIPNQELLEYSSLSNIPYEQNTKKYYGGPAKYLKEENGYFINLLTNERLLLSQDETIKLSKSILDKFDCGNKTTVYANDDLSTQSNVSLYSYMPSDSDDLEYGDLPGTEGTTYIQNHKYFANEPTYGDNKSGTCGAVATQILLNYNNFYNDRRIIADKHLNGWDIENNTLTNPELNPNHCWDPAANNRYVMGSSGINETDTGTYFKYIIDKLPIIPLTGNIKNAIDEIIQERNSVLSSPINYEVNSGYNLDITGIGKSEIDDDRPVCIAIRGETLDKYHYAIAYGYQNKSSSFGFITHLGWYTGDKNFSRIWINAKWCYGYVTLKINHHHVYNEYIENTNEVRCAECGHRNVPYKIKTLSSTTCELLGSGLSIAGDLIIPKQINSKIVISVANSAFANQNIESVSIPKSVTHIGSNAFNNCTSLKNVYFTAENDLEFIGEYAFANCSALSTIAIPAKISELSNYTFQNCINLGNCSFQADSNLKTIGQNAFENCKKLLTITPPSKLENINAYAFQNCTRLTFVNLSSCINFKLLDNYSFLECSDLSIVYLPVSLEYIGYKTFSKCRNLCCITIPNKVQLVHNYAFQDCNNLTIYLNIPNSSSSGLMQYWNSSNRPIVSECTLANSHEAYVSSFTKSSSNPANTNAVNGITNPYRYNVGFEGWYTTSDFSGTRYANISSAPNGTLYAKWKDSCIAEGSMITLADGSQKAVENLTGDESLLVWNLFTGTYDVAPILFIDRDERGEYEVINLNFSDGTTVKVISEHAFFDVDQGKYVYLRNDAAKYIGHRFSKQSADTSENKVNTAVTLLSVDITTETTVAYSPVTYGHLCYYVDGMLTMPGATEPFANIFEVDKDTMRYDADKMQADIAEYGLFTYEEFSALLPVSEEVFEAFGGKYLKVAIGKGLTDLDEIAALIERYSRFLNF